MKFKEFQYPYPSKRTLVYGQNGMVSTTSPLASQVGLSILKKGGNAVDAAIAVASAMAVLEPTSNGLGSDAFTIVYYKNQLYGLNASGRSPQSISIEALKERQFTSIPTFGPVPVGTPGAVGGWKTLHERFCQLDFEELFEESIDLAYKGFPVSPTIAKLWKNEVDKYRPYENDPAFKGFFSGFSHKGQAPKEGEIFAQKDLASTLEQIAKTKTKAFYQGDLAHKICDFLHQHGGFLQKEDLVNYQPCWVEPISTDYRGYTIWEMPPNGHGISVLMALNILKDFDFATMSLEERVHLQIEALKLSMSDAARCITDPDHMKQKVEDLLSKNYARSRRKAISDKARDPKIDLKFSPSTVYFATGDKEGNMVSMIQSNYQGFGSGIVIPHTGISLNNRLANFSFDPLHDNCLKGGKLPYHTIIPGFITKEDRPIGPFGVMGAFMQPQGHLQVLMNMIDFSLNPQSALDAPRFQWIDEKNVQLEEEFPTGLKKALEERGHKVTWQDDPIDMGRGQVILRRENGVYCGGTEKRADGSIAIY